MKHVQKSLCSEQLTTDLRYTLLSEQATPNVERKTSILHPDHKNNATATLAIMQRKNAAWPSKTQARMLCLPSEQEVSAVKP